MKKALILSLAALLASCSFSTSESSSSAPEDDPPISTDSSEQGESSSSESSQTSTSEAPTYKIELDDSLWSYGEFKTDKAEAREGETIICTVALPDDFTRNMKRFLGYREVGTPWDYTQDNCLTYIGVENGVHSFEFEMPAYDALVFVNDAANSLATVEGNGSWVTEQDYNLPENLEPLAERYGLDTEVTALQIRLLATDYMDVETFESHGDDAKSDYFFHNHSGQLRADLISGKVMPEIQSRDDMLDFCTKPEILYPDAGDPFSVSMPGYGKYVIDQDEDYGHRYFKFELTKPDYLQGKLTLEDKNFDGQSQRMFCGGEVIGLRLDFIHPDIQLDFIGVDAGGEETLAVPLSEVGDICYFLVPYDINFQPTLKAAMSFKETEVKYSLSYEQADYLEDVTFLNEQGEAVIEASEGEKITAKFSYTEEGYHATSFSLTGAEGELVGDEVSFTVGTEDVSLSVAIEESSRIILDDTFASCDIHLVDENFDFFSPDCYLEVRKYYYMIVTHPEYGTPLKLTSDSILASEIYPENFGGEAAFAVPLLDEDVHVSAVFDIPKPLFKINFSQVGGPSEYEYFRLTTLAYWDGKGDNVIYGDDSFVLTFDWKGNPGLYPSSLQVGDIVLDKPNTIRMEADGTKTALFQIDSIHVESDIDAVLEWASGKSYFALIEDEGGEYENMFAYYYDSEFNLENGTQAYAPGEKFYLELNGPCPDALYGIDSLGNGYTWPVYEQDGKKLVEITMPETDLYIAPVSSILPSF